VCSSDHNNGTKGYMKEGVGSMELNRNSIVMLVYNDVRLQYIHLGNVSLGLVEL
jgi:hypothetical protein